MSSLASSTTVLLNVLSLCVLTLKLLAFIRSLVIEAGKHMNLRVHYMLPLLVAIRTDLSYHITVVSAVINFR